MYRYIKLLETDQILAFLEFNIKMYDILIRYLVYVISDMLYLIYFAFLLHIELV